MASFKLSVKETIDSVKDSIFLAPLQPLKLDIHNGQEAKGREIKAVVLVSRDYPEAVPYFIGIVIENLMMIKF